MVTTELKLWLEKEWKKYIPLVLFFLFIIYKTYTFNKDEGGGVSVIHCLYTMLKGSFIPDIDIDNTSFVRIPYLYLIFNMYIIYIFSYYPFKNMKNIDIQFILRHQNRNKWWIGKCIWSIFSIISFYVLGLIMFLITDFINRNILNKKVNDNLIHEYTNKLSNKRIIIIVITAIIISISIHMLQMVISVVFSKMAALITIIFLYIISIYKSGHLLLGNYLMILRYISLDGKMAVNEYTGMIIGIGLIVLSIIVGCVFVKKVEFI